jgi:ribosomal protein S18 acetylase RimI-like enzyme
MKTKTFPIRAATHRDIEAVYNLFAEVDRLHYEALPHIFCPAPNPAPLKDYFAQVIEDPKGVIFVVEDDQQIIAAILAWLREAREIPLLVTRQYASIENIAVSSSYRRMGIGETLLKRLHQWAREQGVDQVELSVWEFNLTALAFYEKSGYQTIRRRMWTRLS